MEPNTGGSWLEDLQAVNAIALAWYRTVTQNVTETSPQPGVAVTTPGGSAQVTASPAVWLVLAGLIIALLYFARR